MFLFHFSNSNVTFQGLKRWQIKIKLSPTAKCFRNLLDVYCPQGGLSTSINGIINHISRGPFHPGGPHSFSAIYWPIQPIYHWMPGFHRIVHAGACEPPLFWCFLPPKQGRISNQKKGQLGSSFFFCPNHVTRNIQEGTCFEKKSSITHVFFVVSCCLNGKCTFHQFHPRFVGHPPQFLLRNRKG